MTSRIYYQNIPNHVRDLSKQDFDLRSSSLSLFKHKIESLTIIIQLSYITPDEPTGVYQPPLRG
jgi:hypothetical protein